MQAIGRQPHRAQDGAPVHYERHCPEQTTLTACWLAQPKLVTPVLQVVHCAITRFLLDQAGLKAEQADSGWGRLPSRQEPPYAEPRVRWWGGRRE